MFGAWSVKNKRRSISWAAHPAKPGAQNQFRQAAGGFADIDAGLWRFYWLA